MARTIAVYRESDLGVFLAKRGDVLGMNSDCWAREAEARCLFVCPLGSETAIRETWSGPAARLNLKLLATLPGERGREGVEWSTCDLRIVTDELDALEQHWRETDQFTADLSERMQKFRQAVDIAVRCDGVMTID